MNLKNARVVGFSTKTTKEGQPAGTCDHCGTGIKYLVHVIDPSDGVERVIGTSCANKVGNEAVRTCVRERITEDERQRREEKWKARYQAEQQTWHEIQMSAIRNQTAWIDRVADIVVAVRDSGNTFLSDLGCQLSNGALSDRQAHYVALYVIGAKRVSKKNEDEYCRICDVVCGR
jgi:hypothetical protein